MNITYNELKIHYDQMTSQNKQFIEVSRYKCIFFLFYKHIYIDINLYIIYITINNKK